MNRIHQLSFVLEQYYWLLPGADSIRGMFLQFPPILEKVLRTILVYLFLVVGLRLAGKRELAQLNPFDLVVLLLLSNTVQNAIIGNDNSLTGGLIGAGTLLGVNYFVIRFVFKHRRLDQLIEGEPTELIKDGKLIREALAKELLSESELHTVAHRQGFKSLKEIKTARLESGGSFYLEGKTPSTAKLQHEELLKRLDDLSRQIAALQVQKG
jgi:uncharacterized membrane protein YcaP (DUF421 family)